MTVTEISEAFRLIYIITLSFEQINNVNSEQIFHNLQRRIEREQRHKKSLYSELQLKTVGQQRPLLVIFSFSVNITNSLELLRRHVFSISPCITDIKDHATFEIKYITN